MSSLVAELVGAGIGLALCPVACWPINRYYRRRIADLIAASRDGRH